MRVIVIGDSGESDMDVGDGDLDNARSAKNKMTLRGEEGSNRKELVKF